MNPQAISLNWFNERSQTIAHPQPWQSAQLEMRGLSSNFPWEQLRLYCGIYAQEPTPLYLKRKTNRDLVLHADWPAAEPGFHHLRMHNLAFSHTGSLWHHCFFIEAPPLTQKLWIEMLSATYKDSYLRFQPRAPVPLRSTHSPKAIQTLPSDPRLELSRIQWLLSPAARLSESLALLSTEPRQQLQPLYRTRNVSPAILHKNIKALPPHTPVVQLQKAVPDLGGMLHFLMLSLFQRYRWLIYMTPQLNQENPHLPQTLQQLSQNAKRLWQQWQLHSYRQSTPYWGHDSLKDLNKACYSHPELKPWLNCAQLLSATLAPGQLAQAPLFTGYIGFGYVYQYWCTQHLQKALDQYLLSAGWQPLAAPVATASPTANQACHWQSPRGERLMLQAERRYAPLGKPLQEESLYSISRGQQPDISLLYFESGVHWQQQKAHSGLVFEIKFRQDGYGRPRKVDLDRLHAYRDAIYIRAPQQSDRRLFVGGALLYPGQHERYTPGLEALTCLPQHPLRLEYLLNHLLHPQTNA